MKKLSDAKVRVFWAENKYLGVFLAHLLRQGGGFATKGRNEVHFCRKGNNAYVAWALLCVLRYHFRRSECKRSI